MALRKKPRPDALPADASPRYELPPVVELSPEEARALFDAEARRLMGMSGEEFLRRLDAGDFDDIIDDIDHPEVGQLESIRSFAR